MEANQTVDGGIVMTITITEMVAVREVVAFSDFNGALPDRDPAEVKVVSRLLKALDPLIPSLGSDGYGSAVPAAWQGINAEE